MKAVDKYNWRATQANSLLCVGLDSAFEHIPEPYLSHEYPLFTFNRWIIEQTHEYVSAYKPNIAFYEARGDRGITSLRMTLPSTLATFRGVLVEAARRTFVVPTSQVERVTRFHAKSFFFASSCEVPLSFDQASYLAPPMKSKKPGFSPFTSPSVPCL